MIKNFIAFMQKHQTLVFRLFFGLWAAWLLLHVALCLFTLKEDLGYNSYPLSDFMINYEGGFVRRGILGEIFLTLYRLHPYSLWALVAILLVASFVLLQGLLVKLYKKEGWSYITLLAPFTLLHWAAFRSFTFRRDSIVLLIVWAIFHCYNQYCKNGKTTHILIMHLLSVFVLLMHEATFFFAIPILMIHYIGTHKDGKHFFNVLMRCILFFSPALLAMLSVCLFKGDNETAQAIWDSWKPCMNAYPIEEHNCMGAGVEALTWETWNTFKSHLRVNFSNFFIGPIPSFPFTLLNLICIYYLMTRINTINMKWNVLRPIRYISMSNIFLLQFIFMLPMFSVLSCDWGRTLPYWVYSSLLTYHYWKDEDCWSLKHINGASEWLQNKIGASRILSNPWFYFIILFLLPIPGAFGAKLYQSNIVRIIYDICTLLNVDLESIKSAII